MKEEKSDKAPEIVIIKRKKGGDDCHHGGVWKVAYADFMTAMMAFFLVMWLINAANEETRIQVASYFNPVKLVDTTTNPRGLEETKDSSSGDVENRKLKNEAKVKEGEANAEDDKKRHEEKKKGPAAHLSGGDIPESELFRDPVRTLDRIAGGAPDLLKGLARPKSKARELGANGGEQFRDPFSPRTWRDLQKMLPDAPDASTRNAARGGPDYRPGAQAPSAAGSNRAPGRAAQGERAAGKLAEGDRASGKVAEGKKAAGKAKAAGAQVAGGHGQARARKVAEEIRAALKREVKEAGAGRLPQVSVKRTPEGILISLTDKAGFGMFEVGSAKPRRETVRFMERVARILADKPGEIIIRGHTDGRPFRSDLYDNWRLSTARAHAARYMLLRGGIADERIVRVEGYADKKLAVPDNPLADRNRRIEILLKEK